MLSLASRGASSKSCPPPPALSTVFGCQAGNATLREALDAPFIFRSETVETANGWIRTLSYPEIGCSVQGEDVIDLVDELETERLRAIVRLVESGTPPSTLRHGPFAETGIETALARAGLHEWIDRLDVPIGRLARTPGARAWSGRVSG